jgi:heat shock protein HslJ
MKKRLSPLQRLTVATIALGLQSISFTSFANDNAIYQQAWQLTNIDKSILSEQAKPYFLFTPNGKVYGYGICNYFSGKFKSNSSGEFLITQLNRSNETCENNEQVEVKLMASILMSNRFKIEDGQLQLLNEQSPTVTFDPKNDVNKNEFIKQATQLKTPHKAESSGKKSKHGKKGKKAAKATSKAKAGAKKVRTNQPKIASALKAKVRTKVKKLPK